MAGCHLPESDKWGGPGGAIAPPPWNKRITRSGWRAGRRARPGLFPVCKLPGPAAVGFGTGVDGQLGDLGAVLVHLIDVRIAPAVAHERDLALGSPIGCHVVAARSQGYRRGGAAGRDQVDVAVVSVDGGQHQLGAVRLPARSTRSRRRPV